MSVNLPSKLIQSTAFPRTEMNYTPLHLSDSPKPNGNKLYLRMMIFLVVVGIFTSGYLFIYKNSNARTLTSDKDFMNDVATLARSRKVVVEEEDQTVIIEQKNLFTIIVDTIKKAIFHPNE